MPTLNLNKAEFLKSAVSPSGFLAADLPCIVFAGKSNVGKSSVINRLLNRKNFAASARSPVRPSMSIIFASTAGRTLSTFRATVMPASPKRSATAGVSSWRISSLTLRASRSAS